MPVIVINGAEMLLAIVINRRTFRMEEIEKNRVIFKFDREKDIFNCWETCNKDSSWYDHKKNVSPTILEICERKEFNECKDELLSYRKKMYFSGFIEEFVKSIQNSWNKIGKEYFDRLEKIMKVKSEKKFVAYVTTVTRCPYSIKEDWFMVSFFRNIIQSMVTTGHEIMHLYFHEFYWDNIEKQIGKEKTGDLKESLTILLNLEFQDLWFVPDLGYPKHKELREFISETWKKKKDFEILLKECVEYLNKND